VIVMHDSSEATRSLITLCARWRHAFPDQWRQVPQPDGWRGTDRDLATRIGRRLNHYPYPQWPVGSIPYLSHQEWRQLRDTGARDSIEHATEVFGERGFELVAEHAIDTGLHAIRLFLHDGVLAQIEGVQEDGDWVVSGYRTWGCARITDWELFDALTMSSYRTLSSDHQLHPDSRRMILETSTFAGSFGLGWLSAAAAVAEWITPWPEPAVSTWLGPKEPNPSPPSRTGPDLDEARRIGRRNTATLLDLLPDHVHDRLGTIAEILGPDH
jgi:hypothetical protein